MVEVRVLGAVEVRTATVTLSGSDRQLAVLAMLVAERGRVVSADRLIDQLWDGEPPASGAGSLQAYVSRLRRVLEPDRRPRGAATVLVSEGSGYALRLDPDAVDAWAFERDLVGAADRPAEQTLELLQRHLAGWRGQAYAQFADEEWARAEILRLAESRWAALELVVEAMLKLGRAADAVAIATELTDAQPLRSSGWRLLALSLWGANRSADALEILRLHRHHLAEETGLDPEPTIVALEQAIREQRPEFGDGDGSPGAFRPGPGLAAASIRPAQLPWASATFAGRSDQLSQLSAQARSGDGTVLAVIAGSGGVGKTMLALRWAHEVADRYPDGQLFADLRGYGPSAAPAEPGDILGGFLLALGVPDGGVPPGTAERTALFRTVVAGRRLLLVLDNARDAEQVRPLLPGTPGCAVVVTSRSGLAGLVVAEGARPVPLDAFTDDEARDYLRVRLGAEIADADPAERDAVIARCGGLPLALAVVCARAASLPLATVMAELAEEQGLDAFAAPGVTHDVRSVFSWSYRCLPDEAAELFRHLALHPGPDVSLAAATAMAGGDRAATRRLLRTLCDAHLLTERRPGRFVFHDLIRAYATELAERLDPPERRKQPLRRLAEHYLFSADNMCKVVFPYPVGDRFGPAPPGVAPVGFADAETAMAWMDAEYENAMSVALLFPDLVGGFVWALGTYQQNLRFHLDHSIRLCRAALEVAADRNDAVHTGFLHYVIARALVRLDRRAEARGHLEQAIAVGRTTADPVRTANGLLALSLCIIGEHEIPTAEEAAEAYPYAVEAREIYRAMNDDVGRGEEANTLHPIGWYHFYQPAGRDEALRYFRDAIELIGHSTSDPMTVASAWLNLGLMLRQAGDPVAAVDAFERALTSYADMPELRLGPLAELYVCFREMGEAGKARRIRSEARELLRTARHPDVARVAGKLDIPVAVAADRPSRPDHDGGRTTS